MAGVDAGIAIQTASAPINKTGSAKPSRTNHCLIPRCVADAAGRPCMLASLMPYPAPMALSMSRTARPVYETMWGPNEFTCTGTLMDWDVTSRLSEINVSTLILCGEHDEVTPDCSETMHAGIANSELVVFENASHSAHFEQPERFFAVLRDFLRRNETRVA